MGYDYEFTGTGVMGRASTPSRVCISYTRGYKHMRGRGTFVYLPTVYPYPRVRNKAKKLSQNTLSDSKGVSTLRLVSGGGRSASTELEAPEDGTMDFKKLFLLLTLLELYVSEKVNLRAFGTWSLQSAHPGLPNVNQVHRHPGRVELDRCDMSNPAISFCSVAMPLYLL